MEEIKDVVQRIVGGCSRGGVVVSDVLAAFVARTVSYLDDCSHPDVIIPFLIGYRSWKRMWVKHLLSINL